MARILQSGTRCTFKAKLPARDRTRFCTIAVLVKKVSRPIKNGTTMTSIFDRTCVGGLLNAMPNKHIQINIIYTILKSNLTLKVGLAKVTFCAVFSYLLPRCLQAVNRPPTIIKKHTKYKICINLSMTSDTFLWHCSCRLRQEQRQQLQSSRQ